MSYAAFYDHAVAEEADRLTALGDAINDGTFRRLAQLGLRPDARCLDIGSGTGPIATRLCELCPDGEVVATDIDVSNLEPNVPAGVQVLRHDVTVDEFRQGSFDLIVARWVFAHLPRPAQVLARIADWLAPGGCLLIEDPADFAMHCSPNPTYRKVTEAVIQTLAHLAGTDVDWARSFPQPLAGIGLERIGLAADLPVAGPGTPMTRFLTASVQRIADPLLAIGRVTAAELAQWTAELSSDQFWDLGLANVAAWGYRAPIGPPPVTGIPQPTPRQARVPAQSLSVGRSAPVPGPQRRSGTHPRGRASP
jgi:SAM-dependent methyltransferase